LEVVLHTLGVLERRGYQHAQEGARHRSQRQPADHAVVHRTVLQVHRRPERLHDHRSHEVARDRRQGLDVEQQHETRGHEGTAAADYAVRAALTLAAREAEGGPPVTADELAEAQQLPRKFLDQVLGSLRRAGLVHSQRGAQGGYRLALHASDVSIADVIRAVEGPMAHVRGVRPEMLEYEGEAAHLQSVWVAVRASLRQVL